jgi:hypothetical protein
MPLTTSTSKVMVREEGDEEKDGGVMIGEEQGGRGEQRPE